jgi:outer membrane lipoprotein-sorting protein
MRLFSKFFLFLSICSFLPAGSAFGADELNATLAKLDAAAARFKSTTAEFEFDSIQTDPIPDKDVQKGVIYFERTGDSFQMAAHINEVNGRPVPKVYTYSKGKFRLWEGGNQDQVTTFARASKFETYLMFGFGAGGKALSDMWNITYGGSEMLDGVKTEKLELVAKDPEVKKNLPKVTVWMDTDRGVSLKQVFDEGPGQYRVSVYFNIKVNQPLPGDAFTFKTDSKTQYVNR